MTIKLAGDSDYKLGVVTDTSECPRIRVRTLTHGKRDEPLIHSLNLGLLFRDPPSQSSNEILAENEARQRAADGLEKAWHDQPANKILMKKRKLADIHEKQILAGVHRGRINMVIGLTEPYYILYLPSPEELHIENVIDLKPRDAKTLRQAYKHIRMKSNLTDTHKINFF